MKQIDKPNIDQNRHRMPDNVESILGCGHMTVHQVLGEMGKVINESADEVNHATEWVNEVGGTLAENENERIENENERKEKEVEREVAEQNRAETFEANEQNRAETFEAAERERQEEHEAMKHEIVETYDVAMSAADTADRIINGTQDQKRYELMMTHYAIREISDTNDSINEFEVYFAEENAEFITRYVHLDKGMKIRIDAKGGRSVSIKLFNVLDDGEPENKVVTTGSHVMLCAETVNGVLEYNVVLTGNYVMWLSDGQNYLIEPTELPVDQPVVHKPAAWIVVEDHGFAGIHEAVTDLERRMVDSNKELQRNLDTAIKSVSVGGIALAAGFGDSKVLGINQKFLSEKFNELQGTVNELVVGRMTIALTVTPSVIFVGETKEITLAANISDTASKITISGGNIPAPVVEIDKKTLMVSDTVNMSTPATTNYNAQFIVKGVTQNKTASVKSVYPIYKGFGSSAAEVADDANKLSARTSAAGVYSGIATENNVHYYILVPIGINALSTFTMNATPFVMAAKTETINGIEYKVYESGSTFNNGGSVNIDAK